MIVFGSDSHVPSSADGQISRLGSLLVCLLGDPLGGDDF
jgi:hypothetical protein